MRTLISAVMAVFHCRRFCGSLAFGCALVGALLFVASPGGAGDCTVQVLPNGGGGTCDECRYDHVKVTNNTAHTLWIYVEIEVYGSGLNPCWTHSECAQIIANDYVDIWPVCTGCPTTPDQIDARAYVCDNEYECKTYGCASVYTLCDYDTCT
jgi:hypothetical protein